MMTKAQYERPRMVEYGTIEALTKGDFKQIGGGDGIILITPQGPQGMSWVSPSSF